MRWRLLSILVLVLVVASALSPTFVDGKPRNAGGTFSIIVAGAYRGHGTAVIKGKRIRIDASVKDINGVGGKLNADCKVDRNHFQTESGNVIGKQATFTGRIDIPDDTRERAIRGVRLTGTFKTKEGHYGKVIGWIEGNNEMPIDDDRGRGGKKRGK